jgi:ribosome assembly protein YihI (activator of Der GTPase)
MTRIRDRFQRRWVWLTLTLAVAGICFYQAERPRTAGLIAAASAAEDAPVDIKRVRPLMEKLKAGEKLTPEEQAYLDRARQQMRSRGGQAPSTAAGKGAAVGGDTVDTSGLVPLTDMTGTYKGEDGGLYGGGHNAPPEAHLAAYLKESKKIQPLGADGQPAANGKIGLITIGFSNTHLESADFKQTADGDPQKSSRVVVVDGAIGMRAAVMWAYDGADMFSQAEQQRLDKEMEQLGMPKADRKGAAGVPAKDTWPILEQRLKTEGLAPNQVQSLWMKHVEAGPRKLGDFPAHAKALEADMADILLIAKKRFPNLRVAFLSSRTYGGWAGPNSGSPEPFAYECAFAVRWLIQRQIQGDPLLNYNAAQGEVKAPILLWGPYLWARGDSPRKTDGMVWSEKDVRADDHMHPSAAGCQKVTAMLLSFLKTDAGTRRWFVTSASKSSKAAKASAARLKRAAEDNKAPAAISSGFDMTPPALPLPSTNALAARPAPPAAVPATDTAQQPIDVQRGKQLMQKFSAGEKLTAEEQAYLERVRQEIRKRSGQNGPAPQGGAQKGAKSREPIPRDPQINRPEMLRTLVPLTELTGSYHGEDGGLYGGGHNEPPKAHLAAARQQSAKIRPLDAAGQPAEDGKIVLMSVGLSHTTMEFSEFTKAADADAQKSPKVVVVDGAQGGKPALTWALSGAQFLPREEVQRLQKEVEQLNGFVPQSNRANEWDLAEQRLHSAGVTPQQVQVIWLKEAVPMPSLMGEFPAHARAMAADITSLLVVAKKRYPNLRIVYLSSRSFGGYAHDGKNPEPYAYENAFAVRWVIQSQIQGDAKLNYDPARGPVTAPLLLWGPYLWANGTTPRKSDGLIWEESDFGERDGMHPSASGKRKVVEMLLKFFKTDPLARAWFVKQ